MPGVVAVITGEDWAAAGLGKAPCISPVNFSDGRKMNTATRPILVTDKICHVGDPVAAVIAESRWQALAGAEAVEIDYAALPAVTDTAAALADDAPILHEALGTNLIFDVEHGDKQKTTAAFKAAHHVAKVDLVNNRISANPIEPRCCLGKYDRANGHYTLYTSNQAPHLLRARWRSCAPNSAGCGSGATLPRSPSRSRAAGVGTWGSRSLVMAGMALTTAADRIFAKCQQLAAHLLECAEADLDVDEGQFTVKVTDRALSFHEVSRAAYHGSNLPDDFEIGLDETVFYEPEAWVFSSSIHLAVVVVDAETGLVTLRDYFAIDDSGRVINPMIVEGQLHGAIAQGAGQALIESCVYDTATGQLLSGSFMDYGMPRARRRQPPVTRLAPRAQVKAVRSVHHRRSSTP